MPPRRNTRRNIRRSVAAAVAQPLPAAVAQPPPAAVEQSFSTAVGLPHRTAVGLSIQRRRGPSGTSGPAKRAVKKAAKKATPLPTTPRTSIIIDQDSCESQASVQISDDGDTYEPSESIDSPETALDEKTAL